MPVPTSRIREVITKKLGLDAVIIPMNDPHFCEYVADRFNYVKGLSGFTGSAGTLLVTRESDGAYAFSDSRYRIQLVDEVNTEEWQVKIYPQDQSPKDFFKAWVESLMASSTENAPFTPVVLGYDPSITSIDWYQTWSSIGGVTLKEISFSTDFPVDFQTSSALSEDSHSVYSVEQYTSRSFETKMKDMKAWLIDETRNYQMTKGKTLSEFGGDIFHVSAELDVNAWLLNLRGHALEFLPVFFSFCVFRITIGNESTEESAIMDLDVFVDEEIEKQIEKEKLICVTDELKAAGFAIHFHRYASFVEKVSNAFAAAADDSVVVSIATGFSQKMNEISKKENIQNIKVRNLKIHEWMAKKDEKELQSIRDVQLRDSRLINQVLHELRTGKFYGKTEADFSQYLAKQRQKAQNTASSTPLPVGGSIHESFDPIVGFGKNSASIHHRADTTIIGNEGILLLDNGGIYREGVATDCTRTIWISDPNSSEEPPHDLRKIYTIVLQGHIRLAKIPFFPKKACGLSLATLALSALWENGYSCLHGISHGVGVSVHEGPFSISGPVPRRMNKLSLFEGATLSNEPGIYTDKYGVRLENVYEVVPVHVEDSQFPEGADGFKFEPLTFVPFEDRLILLDMLNEDEKKWLQDYQEKSREVVCGTETA